MKTCLYRTLGECIGCKEDYNPYNHPNNYDCPKYHEINMLEFNVMERESLMYKIHLMDKNIRILKN